MQPKFPQYKIYIAGLSLTTTHSPFHSNKSTSPNTLKVVTGGLSHSLSRHGHLDFGRPFRLCPCLTYGTCNLLYLDFRCLRIPTHVSLYDHPAFHPEISPWVRIAIDYLKIFCIVSHRFINDRLNDRYEDLTSFFFCYVGRCEVFPTTRVYLPSRRHSCRNSVVASRPDFSNHFHRKVLFLRTVIDEEPTDSLCSKLVSRAITAHASIQQARLCVGTDLRFCYPFPISNLETFAS